MTTNIIKMTVNSLLIPVKFIIPSVNCSINHTLCNHRDISFSIIVVFFYIFNVGGKALLTTSSPSRIPNFFTKSATSDNEDVRLTAAA